MYWVTLRWSKHLAKRHLNIFNRLYSGGYTSMSHLEKYDTWFNAKVSCNYGGVDLLQHLFSNNIPLRMNQKFISTCCVMRKGRDKGDKKKPSKAQHIDLNETKEVLDLEKFIAQMEYAIEQLKENFVKHLTLRSSAGSIDQVVVNFEGENYILQELVQIVHKPKMVVLNVTSFPQAIPQILKALVDSGLNLNPQQDGTTLFIPIPKVTKEHREGLAKNAKALYIKSRDNIKDIKNKELKKLSKIPSLPEDKARRIHAQLEALCIEYVKKADGILDAKQKELLRSSE